ncbi:16281_t:CDS:2, partial [Rhizophagus irregularis]
RDLFWNQARMPQETQLDIEKTFELQKDLVVKTIVPNLMKTLDLDTYTIGEGVIYEMIHQRHRHKRDNLRVKNKSENDIKKETGRKHQNSRRSEKRKKRSKTINNLRNLNDPLIQKFSNEELRPIITENGYHSPEISESEDGNTTKGDKKRERMYKPSEYVEETVPNSTPSWTKSGYDGPLKNPVIKAISKLQNK